MSTTIVYGENNDNIKEVVLFMNTIGINISVNKNVLDDKLQLALLLLQEKLHITDYVECLNKSINELSNMYQVGKLCIIKPNAKLYNSSYASSEQEILKYPTYCLIQKNNYTDFISGDVKLPLFVYLKKSLLDESTSKSSYEDKCYWVNMEDVLPSPHSVIISSKTWTLIKTASIFKDQIMDINWVNVFNDPSAMANEYLPNKVKELYDEIDSNRLITGAISNTISLGINQAKRLFTKKYENKIIGIPFYSTGITIKNLATNTTLYIPFKPDGVDDRYSVSWSEDTVRGGTHKIFGYDKTTINSSPTLNFKIDVSALSYYASRYAINTGNDNTMIDDTLLFNSDVSAVNKKKTRISDDENVVTLLNDYLNVIKSLAFPYYGSSNSDDGGELTPPSVYVSVTNNFRFIGIVTDITIAHSGQLYNKRKSSRDFEFDSANQVYMTYDISISFNKVTTQDFSSDMVEIEGDEWRGGQDKETNESSSLSIGSIIGNAIGNALDNI